MLKYIFYINNAVGDWEIMTHHMMMKKLYVVKCSTEHALNIKVRLGIDLDPLLFKCIYKESNCTSQGIYKEKVIVNNE